MKKVRTLISIVVTITVILSTLITSAFAGLTEVELTEGTNDYDWDPDIYQVKIDNDIPGAIRMISYFKWTDITKFPKYEDKEFYTHEHYDLADSGHASEDDMYTNLPCAEFDIDNDWFTGGGDEELEVTCANWDFSTPILEDGIYFFDTTWTGPIENRDFKGSVRSQISVPIIEFDEKETEFKGDLATIYSYGSTRQAQSNLNIDGERLQERQSISQKQEEILIVHNTKQKSNITALEATQMDTLHTASTPEELSLMENATVVVTFVEPISNDTLDQILDGSNATLDHCVIRYEDASGNRITGWTSDTSDEHLTDKLNHLNKRHDNVSYSGIVSATISVDLSAENYAALTNSNYVYFVDLSDPITRLEHQDFNRELDVHVCDLSWDLEFMS